MNNITNILAYIIITVFIISCGTESQTSDNTSIDNAAEIGWYGAKIRGKDIDVTYYYELYMAKDGSVIIKVDSTDLEGITVGLYSKDGKILRKKELKGDSTLNLQERIDSGYYYVGIRNSLHDDWDARMTIEYDFQYIPRDQYPQYIVGSWCLYKMCMLDDTTNCQIPMYSEVIQYYENGTDSIFLGGQMGGSYGPFDYKFKGDSIINTNKANLEFRRGDYIEMRLDTLRYIRADKPTIIFYHYRQRM